MHDSSQLRSAAITLNPTHLVRKHFICVLFCVCVYVCVYLNVYLGVHVCVSCACFHVCEFVHICVCVCVIHMLIDRPEDHCGRSNPVCEEAVGRDDPDRLLSQCLRSDWTATVHGEPAE